MTGDGRQCAGRRPCDSPPSPAAASPSSGRTAAASFRSGSSSLLFAFTLSAEFVANDRPLLIRFDNHWYVPVLLDYSEDAFGADFLPTEADYTDPDVEKAINAHGWMIWPAVPFSYDTIVKNLTAPAPSPPSWRNPLGTDDQARDVLARVIYGFRLSVLFGFVLTAVIAPRSGSPPARCRAITAAWSICCSSASSRSGTACRSSIC